MYLQEQFRRQRHYQLKLFNKYEINWKYINNGIEKKTWYIFYQYCSSIHSSEFSQNEK